MKKLDLKTVGKLRPNPLFKGLPVHLKDPANYQKTEDDLKNILKTDHIHKTASSYVKCNECQEKLENKKKLMKKLGFKSFKQYLEWRKIMDIIINKKDFQLR
jgi:hypothetical protein